MWVVGVPSLGKHIFPPTIHTGALSCTPARDMRAPSALGIRGVVEAREYAVLALRLKSIYDNVVEAVYLDRIVWVVERDCASTVMTYCSD